MQPHHFEWLSNHPDRTEQWLRDRLADGFQVHHLDCDHSNNDPNNLVLIDGDDHMRMHSIPVRRKHRTKTLVKKPHKRMATRLRAAEELLRQSGLTL